MEKTKWLHFTEHSPKITEIVFITNGIIVIEAYSAGINNENKMPLWIENPGKKIIQDIDYWNFEFWMPIEEGHELPYIYTTNDGSIKSIEELKE